MILVDTPVWIDHLRASEANLHRNLTGGNVLTHSMVIGEIALGHLPDRRQTLQKLNALPRIRELNHGEVLSLIERKQLMGRGIGFVDAHLICSVLEHSGTQLWTRDKRLKKAAESFGVAFPERV